MRQLLSGISLQTKTSIGAAIFSMAITLFNDKDSAKAPLRLLYSPTESGVHLCVTREDVETLAEMGKDKNGLAMKAGPTDIFLQVDMRRDSRSRKT